MPDTRQITRWKKGDHVICNGYNGVVSDACGTPRAGEHGTYTVTVDSNVILVCGSELTPAPNEMTIYYIADSSGGFVMNLQATPCFTSKEKADNKCQSLNARFGNQHIVRTLTIDNES